MTFTDIRTWVFDLDNTLYPTGAAIYDVIGDRMTDYIAAKVGIARAAALELRERYFHTYGATLAGLMKHHGIDGRDYLDYVHDCDLSIVEPDPQLAALIAQLPGPRIVFTNGARTYAERITERLGLAGLFDDVFDLEAAGFIPKPDRAAFDALLARYGVEPARTLFFEDTPKNLETAHKLGFRTVLIDAAWRAGETFPEHIHHAADDLKAFIRDEILPAIAVDRDRPAS